MKIIRTNLVESGGEFSCTVRVPMEDLGAFLALMPVAERVFDVPVRANGQAADPERRAPVEPYVPNSVPSIPKDLTPPTPINELTQFVRPPGFDLSKLGLNKGLPKELMVFLLLCRDPVFQEWTMIETKTPHHSIPDAVMFAADFVAKAAGAPTIFEIPTDKIPLLAPLATRYEEYVRLRSAPRTA